MRVTRPMRQIDSHLLPEQQPLSRRFPRLVPGCPMNRSHLGTVVIAALAAIGTPLLAQPHVYKVLATSKTSTMQKELQEAGDAGFHFIAVMGGEIASAARRSLC